MPLSSPKRKVSDVENKLRLLLCLDRLGMATQEQLWPFVAQLELMDYLSFCLLIDELKSAGTILSGSHALADVLYLTDAGRQQLALFGGKLLHADRERIERAAPACREQLSMRKQLRAVYELAPDGCYSAALTLREGDVPTLFLRLQTASRVLADEAVQRFRQCVPRLLNQLYTLALLPEAPPAPAALSQEAAIATVSEGHPVLCAFGGREHAAVVRAEADGSRYTVLLLLPTRASAWQWACAADADGVNLARRLTLLLGADA